MRPTPQEIATSMRTLLREQMAARPAGPDLVPLKRVMAALRDMRWNDAAFDLMAETAAMADLIEDCLTGDSGAAVAEREALDAFRAARFPRSFAEANAANAALRAALVAMIARLRAGPQDAASTAARNRIARVFQDLRSAPAA